MSDLYTSQVHLKRLLAGQATPAFTPAPEAVLKMLDPEFFPGMGALNADAQGRLQCPIRGCGRYVDGLGTHLMRKHGHVCTGMQLKAMLGIPKRLSLLSTESRRRFRAGASRNGAPGGPWKLGIRRRSIPTGSGAMQGGAMQRNYSDTCASQLQAKLLHLREKLGRSPSRSDIEQEFGVATRGAIERCFGSLNAAKATCALDQYERGGRPPHTRTTAALVIESIRAWVDIHGDLPSSKDVEVRERTPRVACQSTVKRALGVSSWPAAMRSIGESLGIKSERYGFDFRRPA